VRVLRATLPEPPDVIIQGWQSFAEILPSTLPAATWESFPVLQGQSVNAMIGDAVPRALVGWPPYAAQASSIGPMAMQGGTVGMVPIGPAVAVSPIIDPAQIFLNKPLPQDSTGALYPQGLLPGYAEPAKDYLVGGDNALAALPPLTNIRGEVALSGLLKITTASVLPFEFGQQVKDWPISYQVFTLTGTTVNSLGVPVPGCRVIAYQSGLRYVGGAPIIAETISDGSGVFSMLLRNIDYQLTAYIEGSPDRAGITKQNITPVVSTTIYMSDPTVAPSGGGGTRGFTFA
jgi:hypothetical protein